MSFATEVVNAGCRASRFVNIGMNIGILPVTGITLPFISQGLSSVWSLLIGQGLLQSVLMRHRKLAFQTD